MATTEMIKNNASKGNVSRDGIQVAAEVVGYHAFERRSYERSTDFNWGTRLQHNFPTAMNLGHLNVDCR